MNFGRRERLPIPSRRTEYHCGSIIHRDQTGYESGVMTTVVTVVLENVDVTAGGRKVAGP